jgi:hypothetical protein
MIIKMQKVDPWAKGGARILIKESDRDVSSLEKSSTDIMIFISRVMHCDHRTLDLLPKGHVVIYERPLGYLLYQ